MWLGREASALAPLIVYLKIAHVRSAGFVTNEGAPWIGKQSCTPCRRYLAAPCASHGGDSENSGRIKLVRGWEQPCLVQHCVANDIQRKGIRRLWIRMPLWTTDQAGRRGRRWDSSAPFLFFLDGLLLRLSCPRHCLLFALPLLLRQLCPFMHTPNPTPFPRASPSLFCQRLDSAGPAEIRLEGSSGLCCIRYNYASNSSSAIYFHQGNRKK